MRAMEGQGCLMTRNPFPDFTDCPFSSQMTVASPASGLVAKPCLDGCAEGMGQLMVEPVSVCHQVSMMGQRSFPITQWYQSHAAGLMGSPTVPSKRMAHRSRPFGH